MKSMNLITASIILIMMLYSCSVPGESNNMEQSSESEMPEIIQYRASNHTSFYDGFDSLNYSFWEKRNGTNGSPFLSAFRDTHVWTGSGKLHLKLDGTDNYGKTCTGGELRTWQIYGRGIYEASLKAGWGYGVVTGFFTYTNNPSWHEVDVEILGRYPTRLWCTTFVNGNMVQKWIDTGKNLTNSYHTYKFSWGDRVDWWIDGQWKAYVSQSPWYWSKVMFNIWGFDNNDWAGKYNGYSYSQMDVDWVKFTPY